MLVSLGQRQESNRDRLAINGPYVERADWPGNRLDEALSKTWGSIAPYLYSGSYRWRLGRFVRRVEDCGHQFATVPDEQLHEAADGLRNRLMSATSGHGELALAFALAREATQRHTGMRHFPVQLLGGAAMMSGAIAEMQTGEGKSLTAVLPAVAAALMGQSVHVVTVNDYLARRDVELLRPVYEALGLTVGLIQQGQPQLERKHAYACDVTYCTNKELAFDYLRDRLALGPRRASARLLMDDLFEAAFAGQSHRLVLRGLQFAIIDEADSVLIDEARTPLILSGVPNESGNKAQLYETALRLARQLVAGEDFHLAASEKTIRLTEHGERTLSGLTSGLGELWDIRRAREELVRQALSAIHLFGRDKQYIVSEGKIQIVDEYTGRVMPDRSWEHGLHQLIEAKESCVVTEPSTTLARTTYQRLFRRYLHLCGMTGTAVETSGEMYGVYGVHVVPIPTNRPVRRTDLGFRVFPTSDLKWKSVVESALEATRKGRAVLIGTRSVDASEHVGRMLSAAGVEPAILNARQDRREAEIVANAGQPGRVTVATNMAGRGTDILLHRDVKAAGGLHVVLTEYHESRRIDRQLFGRTGRQGDPGSHEAIVALDDELFQRFANPHLLQLIRKTLFRKERVPAALGRALRIYSQSAAERLHAHARRSAVAAEDRFNKLLGFAGRD
ncbi:DEAD/DEAH box helicase [Taklimakanibacter deserti]|uniref:preprotein translocase subunit SecA n=1 Tax=Taklimakanibacter deserti TaxID=2267839 RepID=UPI0013C4D970